MKPSDVKFKKGNSRRKFMGTLAATAAFSSLAGPGLAKSLTDENDNITAKLAGDADAWFKQLNGAHRVVYDATQPNSFLPFAWPRIFLMTNELTGSKANDCGVVVVLRHEAIPFAMGSHLWEKYHFGEVFEYHDPATNKPSLRNPFWKPGPEDFKVPGFGPVQIGINQLQESGVMFCVCNVALTVYSSVLGEKMGKDPEEIKKEFVSGVLPNIQVVPSGVWALGRAQERDCAYIYAGH